MGALNKNSATGTRTRVAQVRAEYPNQLDYSGLVKEDLAGAISTEGRSMPKGTERGKLGQHRANGNGTPKFFAFCNQVLQGQNHPPPTHTDTPKEN